MPQNKAESQTGWASRLGFLLAAAGASVGLGNIWKFPYIVGANGGSAFMFVYLLCLAFIGLPILFGEIFCGQQGQAEPIRAFKNMAGSHRWALVPLVSLIGAYFVISYYAVVGGWIFRYLTHAFTDDIATIGSGGIGGTTAEQLGYHLIFVLSVFAVSTCGIRKGVEIFNKIAMPGLFALLFALFVYSLSTEGIGKALNFLFVPRFSELTADAVMEAIGHAFFTLGVGVSAIMAYGSYLQKDDPSVPRMALVIAVVDTIVATMAGIVIFAIVFSFGLDADAGPGLIFITLPKLFNQLPFGQGLGVLFFFLVLLSALTSAVSMVEPLIRFLQDRFYVGRAPASVVIGLWAYALGVFVILSGSEEAGFVVFGKQLFDALDLATTHVIMPFVGVGISLFLGWCYKDRMAEYFAERPKMHAYFGLCLKVISPLAITLVALKTFFS